MRAWFTRINSLRCGVSDRPRPGVRNNAALPTGCNLAALWVAPGLVRAFAGADLPRAGALPATTVLGSPRAD